jgi:pimeloyl-ACP methyl ester carboxylesterase
MPYLAIPRGGYLGGSIKIYYEKFGDVGPRVFFVMGFGTAFQAWEEQLVLAKSGSFQAVAFDNRGFGRSSSPYGRYTTSQLADDAALLLKELNWTQDVHLVGHSLGGMIAQELLLIMPETFISAVLMNTHGGVGMVPIWRSLPPLSSLFDMTRFTLALDPLSAIQHQLGLNFSEEFLLLRAPEADEPASKTPGSPASPASPASTMSTVSTVSTVSSTSSSSESTRWVTNRARMFENYFHWWKSHGVVSLAGQLGQVMAVFTHHLTEEKQRKLAALPIPKIVFSSQSDRIIPTASSELLAKVLNAELISVPGGHLVNLEHSDLVNRNLLRLISETDPSHKAA